MIIQKKNREVRLCVDMWMANHATKREHHPTPTLDDLIYTLNDATVFSKLDLWSGYHQLLLAPEIICYITMFATHKGLKWYSRLNFGINSASEIFQNVFNEQIRDISGALNISNDVIFFRKTQAKHDAALRDVFKRFSEINLILNKKMWIQQLDHHSFLLNLFFQVKESLLMHEKSKLKPVTTPTTAGEVKLSGNDNLLCEVYS